MGGEIRRDGARQYTGLATPASDANAALATFLAASRPIAEEGILWGPRLRFHCRAYACEALPPLELVTSVRCVLRRGDAVLVVARTTDDRDECHIMPGGRREPRESVEETLRRELLEETGWTVGELRQLGLIVYHHVLPRPPRYPFPYPEFAQLVYTAEAISHYAEAMTPDEIDGDVTFVSVERVREMRISAWQRAFLELAVAGRAVMCDGG